MRAPEIINGHDISSCPYWHSQTEIFLETDSFCWEQLRPWYLQIQAITFFGVQHWVCPWNLQPLLWVRHAVGMAWYDKFETKPPNPNKTPCSQVPFEKRFRNLIRKQLYIRVYVPFDKKIREAVSIRQVFETMWFFRECRISALFPLLLPIDTCAYPRPCPKCGTVIFDTLSHALSACPKARKIRTVLRLKLLLYNANSFVSPTKFECKKTLYSLAMGDRLVRRSLCEFLVAFGYWFNYDPLIKRFQAKKKKKIYPNIGWS